MGHKDTEIWLLFDLLALLCSSRFFSLFCEEIHFLLIDLFLTTDSRIYLVLVPFHCKLQAELKLGQGIYSGE